MATDYMRDSKKKHKTQTCNSQWWVAQRKDPLVQLVYTM